MNKNKFSDAEIADFVAHLNGVHPSIRFTVELESDGKLPFLDVLIQKEVDLGKFSTSVYRKPTHTDRYLPWDSCHPRKTRIGVLKTLIIRGMRVCSSDEILRRELDRLRLIFSLNGYPSRTVNGVIRETVKNYMNRSSQSITSEDEDERKIFMVIPFIKGFLEVRENCRKVRSDCSIW